MGFRGLGFGFRDLGLGFLGFVSVWSLRFGFSGFRVFGFLVGVWVLGLGAWLIGYGV